MPLHNWSVILFIWLSSSAHLCGNCPAFQLSFSPLLWKMCAHSSVLVVRSSELEIWPCHINSSTDTACACESTETDRKAHTEINTNQVVSSGCTLLSPLSFLCKIHQTITTHDSHAKVGWLKTNHFTLKPYSMCITLAQSMTGNSLVCLLHV